MDLGTTWCTFKLATFVLRSILGNEVVSRNCIFFCVKEESLSCAPYIFIQRSCISGPHCFASLTVLMRPQKSFSYLTFCCGRVSVGINEGFRVGLGFSLTLSCSLWHTKMHVPTAHTHTTCLSSCWLIGYRCWVVWSSSLSSLCMSACVFMRACACTRLYVHVHASFTWANQSSTSTDLSFLQRLRVPGCLQCCSPLVLTPTAH